MSIYGSSQVLKFLKNSPYPEQVLKVPESVSVDREVTRNISRSSCGIGPKWPGRTTHR
jgi:hypothetical protein